MTTATLTEPTPAAPPAEPGWHIAADAIKLSPLEPRGPRATLYGVGALQLVFTRPGGTSTAIEAQRNTTIRAAMTARDEAAVRSKLEQSSDLLRLRHAAAEVAEREGPTRLAAAQSAEARARSERLAIDPDAGTADRSTAAKAAERAAKEASTAAAKLAASQEHLVQSKAAVAREAESVAIETFAKAESARKAEVRELLARIADRIAPELERLTVLGHELSAGHREPQALAFAAGWVSEQVGG